MTKLTADRMKAEIACYWRYAKQCSLVALEATFPWLGTADVLAVDRRGFLIETEVKLNVADLRQDKRKQKHLDFARGSRNSPLAYFYFAVPRELANHVGLLCDNLYPYAGVLGSDCDDLPGRSVRIYRTARLISQQKPSLLQLARIAKQQSGALCRLAIKVAESGNHGLKGDQTGV